MPLTDAACRGAKVVDKPKKLSDGGGLFLFVTPAGSKLWRMGYRVDGKQQTLSICAYPQISLATARGLRDAAKLKIGHGHKPSGDRNAAADQASFKAVATKWFRAQERAWVPAHSERVWSRFENDVFPALGKMHIE